VLHNHDPVCYRVVDINTRTMEAVMEECGRWVSKGETFTFAWGGSINVTPDCVVVHLDGTPARAFDPEHFTEFVKAMIAARDRQRAMLGTPVGGTRFVQQLIDGDNDAWFQAMDGTWAYSREVDPSSDAFATWTGGRSINYIEARWGIRKAPHDSVYEIKP
jgi:hypothetical protein